MTPGPFRVCLLASLVLWGGAASRGADTPKAITQPQERARIQQALEQAPLFAKAVEGKAALDALLDPVAQPLPRAFGRYVLQREVGRGALGIVYEAEDRESGQRFALKVLRPGCDTDAEALERFRREALACGRVQHPGVVQVHEAGECAGLVVLQPGIQPRRQPGRPRPRRAASAWRSSTPPASPPRNPCRSANRSSLPR